MALSGNRRERRERLMRELSSYSLTALYLFVIFGLFTLYRRLILAEYQLPYLHYGISLLQALVLAKVILIGDALGLGRRHDRKPLIYPMVYKALIFGLLVAVFSLLEHLVRGLVHGQAMSALTGIFRKGPYEPLAQSLIITCAFLPFFAVRELERRLGRGAMTALFFGRGRTGLRNDDDPSGPP